jgi:hypothetical protein
MKSGSSILAALPLTLACAGVFADTGTGSVPAAALQNCALISTAPERLACYDRLAGRAPPVGTPAPAASGAAVSAAGTAAAAAAAVAPKPPPAPAADSFGLYAAEHPPAPAPAATLSAKVVGLGSSAGGHPTVALEGGQLWELDEADPLLAHGDLVSIKRAALGSFLLTTPKGRVHRAHRLH